MEKTLASQIPVSAVNSLYIHHISQHPARDSILQSLPGTAFCDVRPKTRHTGSCDVVWDTGDLPGHIWRTRKSRAQSDLAKVGSILYSWSGPQHALRAGPHPDFPRWRSTYFTQEWNPGMDQCVCSTGPGMKQQAHQHSTAQLWRRLTSTLGCCERGQNLQLSLWQSPTERTL